MYPTFKHRLFEVRTFGVAAIASRLLKSEKPILFTGPGSSRQLCENIAHFGHTKVLIVTDAILVELGVLAPIKATLEENGVEVVMFDEIQPDPTDVIVVKGAKLFNSTGCSALIAVGGGSPMDAAKGIASLCANNTLSVKSLLMPLGKKRAKNVYCIPTTSGTGSEVSPAAVISNAKTHEKSIVAIPGMMPLAAAIDTDIIKKMPKGVTGPTGMDALTHAIESFVSKSATSETSYFSKAAISMIMENLPKAYDNPDDIKARELMGMASFYAGYAFSKAYLGYVHSISHRLSKHYGTPHGMANAIVLPRVLEFSLDVIEPQLAELAIAIGEDKNKSTAELAQIFIDRVTALIAHVNIPTTLDKLEERDVSSIAFAALKEAHSIYTVPKYMMQEDCENIVRKLISNVESNNQSSKATAVNSAG